MAFHISFLIRQLCNLLVNIILVNCAFVSYWRCINWIKWCTYQFPVSTYILDMSDKVKSSTISNSIHFIDFFYRLIGFSLFCLAIFKMPTKIQFFFSTLPFWNNWIKRNAKLFCLCRFFLHFSFCCFYCLYFVGYRKRLRMDTNTI